MTACATVAFHWLPVCAGSTYAHTGTVIPDGMGIGHVACVMSDAEQFVMYLGHLCGKKQKSRWKQTYVKHADARHQGIELAVAAGGERRIADGAAPASV
jgi:hypothetical protein